MNKLSNRKIVYRYRDQEDSYIYDPNANIYEVGYADDYGSKVSIYQISGKGMYGPQSQGKIIYGINWAAMGGKSVEEAQEYIVLMKLALKIAKNINRRVSK